MNAFARLIFGRAAFDDDEEYLEFRYRFLVVVMLSGALLTALFLLGDYTGLNRIAGVHIVSMHVFTAGALLLWLLLRGRKERFLAAAYAYELLCLLEYVSVLVFVPQDEMRGMWFLVNIPGVYILLGKRAGMAVAALTVLGLAAGNHALALPYSANGMATLLLGIVYLAVFFHIYGDRSISYLRRMHESNRELRHMAAHDALTGVLNARAYYAGCDRLIRLAQRHGSPYAVLFIDLDHFKAINDTHGHAAGDAVLRAVASAVAGAIRDSDALGRIGGEEFSVFLPATDAEGAALLAEKIRALIEDLQPSIGDRRLRITASIGVASDRERYGSIGEIQRQADQAMYVAKTQGRNRVSRCDERPLGLPEPA